MHRNKSAIYVQEIKLMDNVVSRLQTIPIHTFTGEDMYQEINETV